MAFFRAYYAVFISAFWVILTLIGYFFWSWDIGQTILFLNISFYSLFFNFYLSLVELTYKNTIVAALQNKLTNENLAQPLMVIGQIFVFIFNVGLFTFALAISLMICSAIISSYFYRGMNVKNFDQFLTKWDGQWTSIILLSLSILVLEYFKHRKEIKQLNVHAISDWNIFLPLIPNVKRKFNIFFWGSIVAIILDGLISDFESFGSLSLTWLFICNFIWSYIDVRYKSVPLPLEAYTEDVED